MEHGNLDMAQYINLAKLSKRQIKRYTKAIMAAEIQKARDINPDKLLEEAINKLDYAMQIPSAWKPEKYRADKSIA